MSDVLSKSVNAVRQRLLQDNDLSRKFAGLCGLAQSMLHFGLKDMGYDMRPFSTHSIKQCFFGHSAGSVEIDNTFYLIDATFEQFLESKNGLAPAKILKNTDEGREILNALLEDGYFELPPPKAHLYLESLMNGYPLNLSEDKAMDFILNPPSSAYNLCYGSDGKVATRQSLVDDGYLPEGPVAL